MDKMLCLRAYAPSGIRTHDPLITSREHEPLHYSAPISDFDKFVNLCVLYMYVLHVCACLFTKNHKTDKRELGYLIVPCSPVGFNYVLQIVIVAIKKQFFWPKIQKQSVFNYVFIVLPHSLSLTIFLYINL